MGDGQEPAIWDWLDDNPLVARATELAPRYAAGTPFPHVVVDDFLPRVVLDALVAEFPAAADMSKQFNAKLQTKSTEAVWARMGPTTRSVLAALNSGPFVAALEQLTGIDALIADPHLEGGGQHQTVPGGRLAVHADFIWNDRLRLERRVNVLVYLNPVWHDDWAGHLEFWDPEMTTVGQRIAPLYGRCVVFTTTTASFHGVPDPLACPDGTTRRSLALYYYTAVLPEQELPLHPARFRQRPGSSDPRVTANAEAGLNLGRIGAALVPPILAGPAKALYRRARRLAGGGSGRGGGEPSADR